MSATVVIDRIEGTQAVLIPADGGPAFEVPIDRLPSGAAEGSALQLVARTETLPLGMSVVGLDQEQVHVQTSDSTLALPASVVPETAVGGTLLFVPQPDFVSKARQSIADRLRRLASDDDGDLVL